MFVISIVGDENFKFRSLNVDEGSILRKHGLYIPIALISAILTLSSRAIPYALPYATRHMSICRAAKKLTCISVCGKRSIFHLSTAIVILLHGWNIMAFTFLLECGCTNC